MPLGLHWTLHSGLAPSDVMREESEERGASGAGRSREHQVGLSAGFLNLNIIHVNSISGLQGAGGSRNSFFECFLEPRFRGPILTQKP